MIKRLVVELTEPICECPLGTTLALNIDVCKEDKSYELQVACTECKTYFSIPLSKLRALVKVTRDTLPVSNNKRPKLILLQGGVAANNNPISQGDSDEDQKLSS